MSTILTLYCEVHDEHGPALRLGHSGAQWWPSRSDLRPHSEAFREAGRAEWAEFLEQHEFCRPVLTAGGI